LPVFKLGIAACAAELIAHFKVVLDVALNQIAAPRANARSSWRAGQM